LLWMKHPWIDFYRKNRDPIVRSICTCSPGTGFQSQIDFEIKIADRFSQENRDPIPQ
jgi:hypothetical protein